MSAFDDLMREVLSMVRNKDRFESYDSEANINKRYDQAVKNTREEVLGREALDKKNLNAIQVQEAANAGNLGVEKERSSGALARERLGGDFKLKEQELRNVGGAETENIRAGAHKYGADVSAGATIEASKNALAGHTRMAEAHENVATIGLGAANKDPGTAFIHEAIKADPSIATDAAPDKKTGKTRWQTLLDSSRSMTTKRVPATNFLQPDTATPAPAMATPNPARSALATETAPPAESPIVFGRPLRATPLSWNAKGETVGGDTGLITKKKKWWEL